MTINLFSCARRNEEYVWDRLTDFQKSQIQDASNAACISANTAAIEALKVEMADMFDGDGNYNMTVGRQIKISDGTNEALITVLRLGDAANDDENTVYFLLQQSELENTPDYEIFDNSSDSDYVYKYSQTDNENHLDNILSAACTVGDYSDGSETDTINNVINSTTTDFDYQLSLEDPTGDGEEADRYVYNLKVENDFPAIFQFFTMSYQRFDINEEGASTEDTGAAVSYSRTEVTTSVISVTTDEIKEIVEDAYKCQYSTYGYESATNKPMEFHTSNCAKDAFTVPGIE